MVRGVKTRSRTARQPVESTATDEKHPADKIENSQCFFILISLSQPPDKRNQGRHPNGNTDQKRNDAKALFDGGEHRDRDPPGRSRHAQDSIP
jgi:hypothetical protein